MLPIKRTYFKLVLAPDFRTFPPIRRQGHNKIKGFNLKGQCSALEKDTT